MYGYITQIVCTNVSVKCTVPVIKCKTSKGWIHVDPYKYDLETNSDLSIAKIMSTPITKDYTINKKMGKLFSFFLFNKTMTYVNDIHISCD